MYQMQETRVLTQEMISNFSFSLQEDEKSKATILKYVHDLNMAAEYFNGGELTKTDIIRWKDTLIGKYAAATVNSILAALNGFLIHGME